MRMMIFVTFDDPEPFWEIWKSALPSTEKPWTEGWQKLGCYSEGNPNDLAAVFANLWHDGWMWLARTRLNRSSGVGATQ
jgi:hypothetical protein